MPNITPLNETEETLLINGNFWVSFGKNKEAKQNKKKIVEALEISASLWNINMEK